MTMRPRVLLWVVLPLVASAVAAQAPASSPRGELLYATHCIACHSTRVHWRDKRLATDYASLTAQVARWQRNAGLDWSAEDVREVVRYLDATIYRFPDPAPTAKG